jgi:energy-coupling factor transport system permease protein
MPGEHLTLKIKPELKIISYCLFVVLLFVFDNLPAYLCAAAMLAFFFVKMPLKTMKAGWLPISIFLLFTFTSNAVGRHGRVLFSAGVFIITDEGIHIAAVRTIRVLLMIGGAKVLMSVTKAEEMIDGLGRLFGPLERVGLPARDFFHTMGLTMKCFPVLKNLASEAYKENMRTCDKPGFWGRARVVSSFLMPLFVKSLQSPESFFEQHPAITTDGKNNLGS